MARESALELPSVADATALADWAEATMRVEGRERISRAWLRGRVGSLLSGDEAELDLLLQEVANRSEVAPRRYPFRRTSAGMEIDTSIDGTCYDYLLLCSLWDAPF